MIAPAYTGDYKVCHAHGEYDELWTKLKHIGRLELCMDEGGDTNGDGDDIARVWFADHHSCTPDTCKGNELSTAIPITLFEPDALDEFWRRLVAHIEQNGAFDDDDHFYDTCFHIACDCGGQVKYRLWEFGNTVHVIDRNEDGVWEATYAKPDEYDEAKGKALRIAGSLNVGHSLEAALREYLEKEGAKYEA